MWTYLPAGCCPSSAESADSTWVSEWLSRTREPAATLSETTTASELSRPESETECWTTRLSGTTLPTSTENRGEDTSTSSAGAFLANRGATPVVEGRWRTSGGCGRSSLGLFAKLSPDLSFWKTCQGSLFEDLEQCLEIWPKWGSMQNGACYLRAPLVPHIHGKGCSYWPTPDASLGNGGWSQGTARMKLTTGTRKSGAKIGSSLKFDPKLLREFEEQGGGGLNPVWVEWLAGLPLGWTDLEPLATRSCRSRRVWL